MRIPIPGKTTFHCNDIIMDAMASQITSLAIVYATVYSDTDQRKHQSSASLGFVRGIHRSPVNSPHKWSVTWKMVPFDDVIMCKGSRVLTQRAVTNVTNRYNVFIFYPLRLYCVNPTVQINQRGSDLTYDLFPDTVWLTVLMQTIFAVNENIPVPHVGNYRQSSNIRRTLTGNRIVDHSDVVGASPDGAAPTTSSFST